jgi:hypothetical protein
MDKVSAKLRSSLPIVKPFFPHIAALTLIAVLGWMNGDFESTKAVNNPILNDSWAMPNWAPYHAGPERAIVAALNIWDGKRPTAVKKEQVVEKTWQLVGTVRTGTTFTAIIQFSEGGKIQRAAAGGVLPNGEKVLAVQSGLLQIDVGGNPQEIKMFQPIKLPQTQKK